MEGRLGELIAKIEANDREIEFVNGHALPSGAERLRSAELIAREIEAWRVNSADVVRTNTIRTGLTHGRVNDRSLVRAPYSAPEAPISGSPLAVFLTAYSLARIQLSDRLARLLFLKTEQKG